MASPFEIKFSIPAPPQKGDNWEAEAAKYIEANEGRRNEPYKDSKGYLTVGVGHLVPKGQEKKYLGRKLTDAEVDELFSRDLKAKADMARKKLGESFDKLPDKAKVAVVDGFFRGDLSGSPKALKLIKEGKLKEAADEYLNHAEYRKSVESNKQGKPHGVAKRMERNAEALRTALFDQ